MFDPIQTSNIRFLFGETLKNEYFNVCLAFDIKIIAVKKFLL